MSELLPCPFCGSPARLLEAYSRLVNGKENTVFQVRCTLRECQASTLDWYPAAAAIEAWNRRVQPPTPEKSPGKA